MIAFAAFVFGTIIGSFLNALSFRWGTGVSIMHGRSRCMRCGHTLATIDLVPVFSYLFLRGRCRYCSSPVSIQYPLVELVGGILSVLVYLRHPEPTMYAFWLLISMVMLFVVVYDMRHTIIPWSCSIFLLVLAVINLVWTGDFSIWMLGGALLALPLLLLSLASAGRWMGWGDGFLELSLGLLLGFTAGFTALLLAFWTGAAVGIALLCFNRGVTMKSEVPFAPFLIAGALISHFFNVDFFQTLPLLFS
jgi:prepilin signal peptidase PulO-like enzyme (type II secretory pathway)